MGSFYCLRLTRILLKSLRKFNAVATVLIFFTSLCRRNIQCIKFKSGVDFHRLSPYSRDSREMQREQISSRARQVDNLCN